MPPEAPALKKKDFQSDQEVRWCPGCGDYAILSAVQTVFPQLGIPKEKFVVVSGIGCSSRFPYYMDTYGFHSIHGRAPAVATGLKVTRPDLEVWVATGDGDGMSIGGNHLIHLLRRNVGLKVLLFNNRIYGLTKGQYSPTSEVGKRTKSTPFGSVDNPFNPLSLALGAGATFVARTVDVFVAHQRETLKAAAAYGGTAFLEIFQNCNIYNDKTFADVTDKQVRDERILYVEHGKPLLYGKENERGVRLNGLKLETGVVGEDFPLEDCIVWDAEDPDPSLAFMLAQKSWPDFPTPVGILRRVETPTYERNIVDQIQGAIDERGQGTLEELIYSGDLWTVREDGTVERPDS